MLDCFSPINLNQPKSSFYKISFFIFFFRDTSGHQNPSTGSSRTSSRNYNSPLSVSPHLSPRGVGNYAAGNYGAGNYGASNYGGPGNYSGGGSTGSYLSPAGSALTPVYTTPFTPLDGYHFTVEEVPDFRHLNRGAASGDTTKIDEQLVNQVRRN